MSRPKVDTPSYCLHRRTGRAFVTLDGKQRTLPGEFSAESRASYARIMAEWLSAGRTLPQIDLGCTVSMVTAAFWKHAQAFYVHPDGTSTGEAENYRVVLRPLRRLFGSTQATDFGPRCLKTLREAVLRPQEEVDSVTGMKSTRPGWSRNYANRQIERVKMIFRWAASEEMIPGKVYTDLSTVDSLRAGKGNARETTPVAPVAEEIIGATLPHLPPPVAALVSLQLLTGARGGELFPLRTRDIDRTGAVWKYSPKGHKTAHHGHSRVIFFGPQAQEILRPFLKMDQDAYLFSPADAVSWRNERQRAKRKTPLTPSQKRRTIDASKRQRTLNGKYNKSSYGHAVTRACERAFNMPAECRIQNADRPSAPDSAEILAAKAKRRADARVKGSKWRKIHTWHPHQLRHTAATTFRREGDFEAAKIILGHRTDSMTQHYAERDNAKAEKIVGKIGYNRFLRRKRRQRDRLRTSHPCLLNAGASSVLTLSSALHSLATM